MDTDHFDRLTRAWSFVLSRRGLAGGLGLAALGLRDLAEGKKKKRKKTKKKIKRNDFGCVNVGKFCKNNNQCCSGICEGKKHRKACQVHDQSTCQAGQTLTICGGANVPCATSADDPGFCVATTGNGGYCYASGDCFECTRDADCEAVCGPGAACIICAETCSGRGGTFCAGLAADSCDFDL